MTNYGLADKARSAGLNPQTFRARLWRGESEEKALRPARTIRFRETKKLAISKDTLNGRLRKGLTPEQAANPSLVCEGCGKENVRICADHDHLLGTFRGWLCSHCNTAIGMAFDDPTVLRKLAMYLERTSAS